MIIIIILFKFIIFIRIIKKESRHHVDRLDNRILIMVIGINPRKFNRSKLLLLHSSRRGEYAPEPAPSAQSHEQPSATCRPLRLGSRCGSSSALPWWPWGLEGGLKRRAHKI